MNRMRSKDRWRNNNKRKDNNHVFVENGRGGL